MRLSATSLRAAAVPMLVAAVLSSCGTGAEHVATVDDHTIAVEDFDGLHVDVGELDEYEVAGSALLLILHHAFTTRADDELGVDPDAGAVAERFAERTAGLQARGDLDEQLALRNQTQARVELEAELDVVRDLVGAELVRSEAPGFDLEAAYDAYLADEAEVCIRQIQIGDLAAVDGIIDRLQAGEPFAEVAREVSVNPFVDREPGRSGAGGDFGCSAPMALPEGLGSEAISAPLDEPVGPIASADGVHILLVYDRTVQDLADVRGDVIEHAVPRQADGMFRSWAVAVLQSIDVEVTDEYGRWGVLPETDPAPTVVTPDRYGSIISE